MQIAYVNEKEIRACTVVTNIDTTGTTVGMYLLGPDGTANLTATTAGVAASADLVFLPDYTLSPGMYKLEVVSDVGAANPNTIWPDETDEEYYVKIREVVAVT